MTIALLPSEIARLILNYLKEENLSKTYGTFLDECKYLDECKGFFKQGRTLPKTIHGKTLSQYLVIASDELDEKETKSVSTQTDVQVVQVQTTSVVQPMELVVEKQPSEEPVKMTTTTTTAAAAASQPDEPQSEHTDQSTFSGHHLPTQPAFTGNSTNGDDASSSSFCEIVEGCSQGVHTNTTGSSGDSMTTTTNDHSMTATATENSNSGLTMAGKRLLIGKNVEKIPNLSVSTLERELVSIINDATTTMKSVEEDEAAVVKEHEEATSNFVQRQQQQQQQQQPAAQYQFFEYCEPTKAAPPPTETVNSVENVQSCTQQQPCQNEIVFVTMDSVGNQVGQSKAQAFVTATQNTQTRANQPVYYGVVTGPPGLQPAEATRLLQQQHQQQGGHQQLVIMPQMTTSSPLVNRSTHPQITQPKAFSTSDLKINLIKALNDAPKIKLDKATGSQKPPQLTATTSQRVPVATPQTTNPILNGIISGSMPVENNKTTGGGGTKRAAKTTPVVGGGQFQAIKKACPDRTPSVKAIYDHVVKGGTYEPKKRGRKSKAFLQQEAEAARALQLQSTHGAAAAAVLTNATNTTPAATVTPQQPVAAHVDILGLFNAIDPKQTQQQTAEQMQNDELSELMNLINETTTQQHQQQQTQLPASANFDLSASGRLLRSRSKL